MKVLALDPSSTALGYAWADDGVVKGADVWKVDRDTVHIIRMVESLVLGVDQVIVEIPSSRAYRATGHGLAKYGFAAGCAYATAWAATKRVLGFYAETWTGGRSKRQRQKIALKAFPGLAKIKDPGYDASDAVALLEWWRQNHG